MADRTSARLFGKIFTLLAKNPTDEHKEIAKEIYGFTDDYVFSKYQMCVDEELILLGLARKGIRDDYPEDGEVVIYHGE
ncbi:hypothetical protein SAMN04488128_103178 [Chitinophaga eiseniae]|uniref:Uncharacterized protein n=1 Tax=Chitinophaga eiseniae TaxID=634771 RepID=A0A1T4SPN0_9BACT|nr:hypothetical protein [Chitinophaga eiseniae]SKA29831.1 hypothetical protein SAMN04488128_103178 [Chitinophaga eiseniae]